jgi:hypothetical protein
MCSRALARFGRSDCVGAGLIYTDEILNWRPQKFTSAAQR